MPLTRQACIDQLNAWTQSESLRKHCRSVEIVMRAAAKKYGGDDADEDRWALTGLIHDADYEQWPDEHPRRIVDWLTEQGEGEIAYAVSVHQTLWGLPPRSMLDHFVPTRTRHSCTRSQASWSLPVSARA